MKSNKEAILEIAKLSGLGIVLIGFAILTNWGVTIWVGGVIVFGLIFARAFRSKKVTLNYLVGEFLAFIGGCIWFVTGLFMIFSDQKQLNDFTIYILIGTLFVSFGTAARIDQPEKKQDSSN